MHRWPLEEQLQVSNPLPHPVFCQRNRAGHGLLHPELLDLNLNPHPEEMFKGDSMYLSGDPVLAFFFHW